MPDILPIRKKGLGDRFNAWFNRGFERFLDVYERSVNRAVARPVSTLALFAGIFAASLLIAPLLGLAFFPSTDAGQFVMRVKSPSGTRLEETENDIVKLEALIRRIVPEHDLGMIVSNIGVDPGFSAIYTSNSAMHTSYVQVALKPGHRTGSYEYIARVKKAMEEELPQLTPYFGSGSLVESTLNMGLAAPIDIQISGSDIAASYKLALDFARETPPHSRTWPTSSSRRIWISPRSSSISIACVPANSA